jgi:hypothetical protein
MRKNLFFFFVVISSFVMMLPSYTFAQKTYNNSKTNPPRERTEQFVSIYKAMESNKLTVRKHYLSAKNNAKRNLRKVPVPRRSMSSNIVLYGSVVASDAWGDYDQSNISSFTATDNTSLTTVYDGSSNLNATGGGVVVDGVYYIVSYALGTTPTSTWDVSYNGFNMETWTSTVSLYCSPSAIATDLTYDATTGKVFGCYVGEDKKVTLKTMEVSSAETSEIASLGNAMCALACDAQGQLFGIGADGNLYTIDKANGNTSLVGATGLTPKSVQSATFDLKHNVMYWAACLSDGTTGLYTVNTTTGAATKITSFPNNEEITALYIPSPEAEDGAPAAVENLKLTGFDKGSSTGSISFAMPTKNYAGEPLTGNLNYFVTINDTDTIKGSAEAGANVDLPLTLSDGDYTFMVTAVNTVGPSPKSKITQYIGKGVPGAVDNLKASRGDNYDEVKLSWGTPKYIMKGYVDPQTLTYRVVRHPDNVVVADNLKDSSFVDKIKLTSDTLALYSYSVTPLNGNVTGTEYTSNSVPVGKYMSLPYKTNFSTYDEFNYFTVIDANKDNSSWYKSMFGSGAIVDYKWNSSGMDDWLVTPPLHLLKGKVYHVYFRYASSGAASKMEIKLGKECSVAGLTTQVMPSTDVTSGVFESDVTVDSEDAYYFGVHALGSAGSMLDIDSIDIESGADANAPAAPTGLNIHGGYKGALEAHLSFTTPDVTINGDRLDNITKVNIYRGTTLVGSVNTTQTDAKINYVDKTAVQGTNHYIVAASNEYGEGMKVEGDVYVGFDIPRAPQSASLKKINGVPYVTWSVPDTVGTRGYYVDPTKVDYRIMYGENGAKDIDQNYEGNEYTDVNYDNSQPQKMLSYWIYPKNEIGEGPGVATNSIDFGAPYSIPFEETFVGGSYAFNPWYYASTDQSTGWLAKTNSDLGSLADVDGSDGTMVFIPSQKGAQSVLYSPMITLKGTNKPMLDFYYYNQAESDNTINVYVSKNDGMFYKIKGLDITAETFANRDAGWVKCSASLDSLKAADYITLAFFGTGGGNVTNSYIDNVRLREYIAKDVRTNDINVPKTMTLGKKDKIDVTIKNDGYETASNYSVNLFRNGRQVASTTGEQLEPGYKSVISFEQTPDVTFGDTVKYYAVINFDGDEMLNNNTSAVAISTIKMPRYPTVNDLIATGGTDKVELSWNAPTEKTMSPEPTVDDFETYAPFIIDSIGAWKTVDEDGGNGTATIVDPNSWGMPLTYTNCGKAMAFMVFNPSKAGINTTTYTDFAPHSGSQMLIAPGDLDYSNSDWLISPELSSDIKSVSFYVKSRTASYNSEMYEVAYSTTDREPASFTKIAGNNAPAEWTKITVDIPAGAKYFAIHNTSAWCTTEIMFDDIEYLPVTAKPVDLVLKGYNIYREGKKINDNLVTATSYTDTKAAAGDNVYNVTVVYEQGESRLSNDAVATVVTGIVSASAGGVKVSASHHAIRISNAGGKMVNIYSVGGALEYRNSVADNAIVAVANGVYIVNVNGYNIKLIVK